MADPSIHANNYDRVAGIYDATRGLAPEVAEQVGVGLAGLLSEAGAQSALEVGVGTGRIAVLIAEHGFQVTGVDISREMLRQLRRKRQDVAAVLALDSRLPFRPGTFDAVLFSHVLHLVPDAQRTLDAAISCLRPAGLLLNCEHFYADYPEQRAGERLNEIILEVTGRPGRYHARRVNESPDFAAMVTAVGGAVESHEIAHWIDVNTLRREVDRLQRRVNSNTWAIPEESMPVIVERFIAEAEPIFGGMEVETRARASFKVSVARFPR